MRIGIVGTGISGLVCAHLLRDRHELVIFEADERIGGHTNTVDVVHSGRRHAVDTGFIVFNDHTYPHFVRLLSELGVGSKPSDMSFGFQCRASGLEWASSGWNTIFAQRSNLLRRPFWRMLRDIQRFNDEAFGILREEDDKLALGDYLVGAGYSHVFIDRYIVPMGSAIWSAKPKEFLDFPAATFVRFFRNHGLMERPSPVQWRVVEGGSRRYVDALVAPLRDRIHLACPVVGIERRSDAVRLRLGDGGETEVDRVILAVHSDQALAMLDSATALERQILGSIRYQANEAVLHTDPRVMPRRRGAWASWNYCRPRPRPGQEGDRVFVTYHMNRLQGLDAPVDFFVTLNQEDRIAPEHELARFSYQHPVFDAKAIRAQRLHEEIDGVNRTHFCGAYWGHGFHEDGVRSGVTVARKLGGKW